MKLKKYFSLVFALICLLCAAIPAYASSVDNASLESSGAVEANCVLARSAQAAQLAAPAGAASIESDPPSLLSPGTVNIIIKLRNGNIMTNTSNNIGSGSVIRRMRSNLGQISGMFPPIPTPIPAETQAPNDPIAPEWPTFNPGFSSGPYVPPNPTAEPQAGRFTNVSITNAYGATFETSDINPGTVGIFRAPLMIYDAMFGENLLFTISWYDTAVNETFSQELSLVIVRSDAAYLRLSRTVNKMSASIGESVEFTYSLVNTGARKLTNIRLIDDKIIGKSEVFEPFSLNSGESRDIKFVYNMQSASVVSKPTVTFIPEGSASPLTVTIDKITIGLINAQLTKSVNIESTTPEGVSFTLVLTNNGSQSLSGLTVKDDLGNVLKSGFSLAIGESNKLSHFIPNPESERNVVFYINGVYGDGKVFTDNTTLYTIRPYIDPSLLGLSFRVEVRKPLDSSNNIGLTFFIENTGRVAYKNIGLKEDQLGYAISEVQIQDLPAASEPLSFDVDLTIDEPRDLVFILTAHDTSGNEYQFKAMVNAQPINVSDSIPNSTPESGISNGAAITDINLDRQISEKGQQLMKLWKVLIVIFVISLIAIVALAAIEFYMYRNRKNRTYYY